MNQIEAIKDCARKAAQAARRQDWGMHNSMRDFANRMIALEGDPKLAKAIYAEQYRQWNEEHPRLG